MSKVNKINKLAELYDIYKVLLTDKQKEIFEKYYFEDMSLSEIAEVNNSSRSAITDSLKKTELKIIDLEEKLKILKKNRKISVLIDKTKIDH